MPKKKKRKETASDERHNMVIKTFFLNIFFTIKKFLIWLPIK